MQPGDRKNPKKLKRPTSISRSFEGSGYNYGFSSADLSKCNSYCSVYRELKDKLEIRAPRCRVHLDKKEVKIIDVGGPFADRAIYTLYTGDIVSYFKFNHGTKFVAVSIDANKASKTGYWFINFDAEKHLLTFCSCLNWLFGMDSGLTDESSTVSSVTLVDRKTKKVSSVPLNNCWACGAPAPTSIVSSESAYVSLDSPSVSDKSTIDLKIIFAPNAKRSASAPAPTRPTRYNHPRYLRPHRNSKRKYRRW